MRKKQNKLPEYLTKVTPLSKLLAAILFIALPFIAFGLGLRYQQQVSDAGSQNRCPLYNHRMFLNRPASNYDRSPGITEGSEP